MMLEGRNTPLAEQLDLHPLITQYDGILFSSAASVLGNDLISRCILRLYTSFDRLTRGQNVYSNHMNLHILRGSACNAFVIPLAGRCQIFLTIGLIAAVLHATRLSVSNSSLPTFAHRDHLDTNIPETYSLASAAAMRALDMTTEAFDNCDLSRDNLALSMAQAILTFILYHEFIHISLGHVAYNWIKRSNTGFLEFGNRGLSREECKIRTSFEVEADSMAGALGCGSIFAKESPFEDVEMTLEQKLECWAYGVALMYHILWKLMSHKRTANQLIQDAVTFEDMDIHPDPIKRRGNVQSTVRFTFDPNTTQGKADNNLKGLCTSDRCF
jgi:hypothetical protein